MGRPLALLTNDDGVDALGLQSLRRALVLQADVVVVAPAYQRSACSHAVTLHRAMHPVRQAQGVFAIDGTPADCVYIALHQGHFFSRAPDVVVSGINHGPNLGDDIYYSGTVAGAREGALRGIPGIAFSMDGDRDFDAAAALAARIAHRLLETKLPDGPAPLLNVNFQSGSSKGVRATRLGRRVYREPVVTEYDDAAGREYYTVGGYPHHEECEGSDTQALEQGYASVTPLVVEATNPDHLAVAAYVALEPDPRHGGRDE